MTINKVCLSGIDAIALADQLIRAGEFEVVVAGGQESMSRAPHMLTKSREGFKYGDTAMRDHTAYDGLHDIFTDQAMGNLTESKNQERGQRISREEQDAFAAASHRHAARAWKDGLFDDEVVPVSIPQRKGDPVVVKGMRAFALTPRCRRWRGCGRRFPETARWRRRLTRRLLRRRASCCATTGSGRVWSSQLPWDGEDERHRTVLVVEFGSRFR